MQTRTRLNNINDIMKKQSWEKAAGNTAEKSLSKRNLKLRWHNSVTCPSLPLEWLVLWVTFLWKSWNFLSRSAYLDCRLPFPVKISSKIFNSSARRTILQPLRLPRAISQTYFVASCCILHIFHCSYIFTSLKLQQRGVFVVISTFESGR